MKKPSYFIIDGNSFIYRAFSALPPLSNSKGFPTGAITGSLNMINSIIKRFKPDVLVVAFDSKGKNFRHEIYPEYKANRPSMQDELRLQFQPLKDVINAWGIPQLCIEGVEADDSIITLAKRAAEDGYKVVVSTSDKDMRQAVSEDIHILDTKDATSSSAPYGPEGVFERNGVMPNRIIDLLALMGDKVDNIPGVNGCGEKTALKWLETYGDVENIIEHADEIGGKIGEKLRANIDNLRLSHTLVTINDNVEIGKAPADFKCDFNEEKLLSLCNEYELAALKKNLGLRDKDALEVTSEVVSCDSEVIQLLKRTDISTLFIEAISHNDNQYLFLSENETFYIDGNVHIDLLKDFIKSNTSTVISSMESKDVIKSLYTLTKLDELFLLPIEDIRVLDYVISGGKSKTVSIADLNEKYGNFSLSDLRDKFKLDTKTPKQNKMAIEDLITVKAEEIQLTKKIHFENYLNVPENLAPALNLDNKVVPVLARMEYYGALINVDGLSDFGLELQDKIDTLISEIHEHAGEEFNINSPKVVSRILFDVLELKSTKKSTAEDVLNKISDQHPIVSKILNYRSLAKNKSTFIDGLISRADSNNVLKTTYNQTLTLTGRLSSIDPNLQNIPIRTEDAKRIRANFIARKGYKILAIDYSQIELRILAHCSQVLRLLSAFNDNLDVHTATASELYECSLDEVTDEMRRKAKAVNFGSIYGIGAKKLAAELNIPIAEAKAFLVSYFEKYDVKPYFEQSLEFAKSNLYVETIIGRHIPTKDVNTTNSFLRSHAELAAKNAGIQGTAADIIKLAMVELLPMLIAKSDKVNLFMQVHDELVFEVKEDCADEISKEIVDVMENVINLDVPLIAESNFADNWLDAH
jgi:DNA polymerase-1